MIYGFACFRRCYTLLLAYSRPTLFYEYCVEKGIISQRKGVSFVNHFSYANISSFEQLPSEPYNCHFCVGVHWPGHNYIGSLIIYICIFFNFQNSNSFPIFPILLFFFFINFLFLNDIFACVQGFKYIYACNRGFKLHFFFFLLFSYSKCHFHVYPGV